METVRSGPGPVGNGSPESRETQHAHPDTQHLTPKLWGGRFSGSTDELVERLNNSLPFDSRLWREDIQGSMAHAIMLGEQGIIAQTDSQAIVDGLASIQVRLESGELRLEPAQEDIHSAIESLLFDRIGPLAGKLHTARSRNDQVAADTRLYLRGAITAIDEALSSFQQALLQAAEREIGGRTAGREDNNEIVDDSTITQPPNHPTILPGYTHLQHAQPILLSHHLMAYFWMFQRDRTRLGDCQKRLNVLPLGAGALAGTSFPIDRERVAAILGFDGICENSLDAVSDRDFVIEFLGAASILMMHCSRLAEELILWNSPEFSFVELDDSVTTGSSIMPQKKNPDVAELARGKTGRVYGNLLTLLTVMKGLPLAYNKDMQEDKEPLFDTVDTLLTLLPPFEKTLRTATFRRERMAKALQGDFSTATDLADLLVRRGMPFREAHHLVGVIVRHCIDRGKGLEELTAAELEEMVPGGGEEALAVLSPEASVAARTAAGGTARDAVMRQIQQARRLVELPE